MTEQLSRHADRPLPILRVLPRQVASRVLVVGDPARATDVAGLLDCAEQVGANREYVTYTGSLDGVAVTVCSHGVGGPGAAICFEELARCDVGWIVRAGTCGALQSHIADGALVIATGAVRDEGTTPRLVPLAYPAIADAEVVAALREAASGTESGCHVGLVQSTDILYPSQLLGPQWRIWHEVGALAVEMELSALLIVAALHGLRAGGVFTVDGNLTRSAEDMSGYDPHRDVVTRGKAAMLAAALRALVSLEGSESARKR